MFTKYLLTILDDNECDRNDSCVANSVCNNTPGSYYCECITGFNKVNKTCIGTCFITYFELAYVQPWKILNGKGNSR